MRIFSVSEALIFLNEMMPELAPKSEETLRRAIRSGELKAERSWGREGNKIHENDLIKYSRKYAARTFAKQSKAGLRFASQGSNAVLRGQEKTITDVLRAHLNIRDDRLLVIELRESKKVWEEKKNEIMSKIQLLKNELSTCESQITAFEDELTKLCDERGNN